jgi:hypothetical protein
MPGCNRRLLPQPVQVMGQVQLFFSAYNKLYTVQTMS